MRQDVATARPDEEHPADEECRQWEIANHEVNNHCPCCYLADVGLPNQPSGRRQHRGWTSGSAHRPVQRRHAAALQPPSRLTAGHSKEGLFMKLISFAGVRLIGRVSFLFLALDAVTGCSSIEVASGGAGGAGGSGGRGGRGGSGGSGVVLRDRSRRFESRRLRRFGENGGRGRTQVHRGPSDATTVLSSPSTTHNGSLRDCLSNRHVDTSHRSPARMVDAPPSVSKRVLGITNISRSARRFSLDSFA